MKTPELLFNCWIALERIRNQTKQETKQSDSAYVQGKLAGICLAMQTLGTAIENVKTE